MNKVITIVLAAGAGKRLGGPKALLAWPAATKGGAERPLAIAHAEARLAAESARVLVVVRGSVFHALLAHVRPGIDLVSWTAPDDLGPAGSLAVAAPRIGDADAVIVTPVDVPPASAVTVARLLARLDAGASGAPAPAAAPPLAVRPRHNGRGGHPVVLRAEALQRYLEADPPPLRDHLRALGERCVDEEVDDPGVLHDLNVPVDVLRVLGGPPRFLA
ncbi:nucleotidyltransferase family protein [Sorangium sp. So ce854]|uniref:nucleotidyltransferase family protein n=1 Tax=Sorangium sp. So ce854 TaxID=3133322 RepID=UPI003F62C1D6